MFNGLRRPCSVYSRHRLSCIKWNVNGMMRPCFLLPSPLSTFCPLQRLPRLQDYPRLLFTSTAPPVTARWNKTSSFKSVFKIVAVSLVLVILTSWKVYPDAYSSLRRLGYVYSTLIPILLYYKSTEYWIHWFGQELLDADREALYQSLHQKYAPRVLNMILDVRGLFVKVGQVGAMRTDLFPEEYRKALTVLMDQVPALQGEPLLNLVQQALFSIDPEYRIQDIFATVDPEPIGAASIGQVHRATLHNGHQVVIKIQYPDAKRHFYLDIQAMKLLTYFVQQENMTRLVQEIEKQFMMEFDFKRESQVLQRMHQELSIFPHIVVPNPLLEYCGDDVIVMDYIPGIRLEKGVEAQVKKWEHRLGMTLQQAMQSSSTLTWYTLFKWGGWWMMDVVKGYCGYSVARVYNATVVPLFQLKPLSSPYRIHHQQVVQWLIQVQGYQMLKMRLFQGDPHLGNFLLTPDNQLGLIDFGQVKSLTPEQAQDYAQLLLSLAQRDKTSVVTLARRMGFKTQNQNDDVLYKLIVLLFDRLDSELTQGLDKKEFMQQLSQQDRLSDIPEHLFLVIRSSMLLRSVGMLFGLPSLSLAKEWESYAHDVVKQANRMNQ